MSDRILASFPHPINKKASAAVVDDGRAGYLRFYQGLRKKEQCGMAWIYNRPSTVESVEAEFCDAVEHDPMPTAIVGPQGVCADPEKSVWSMIWEEDSTGCVLLQDGRPVVIEDTRVDATYCAGLADKYVQWSWKPLPSEMVAMFVSCIRPAVDCDGERILLPDGADVSADYRLALPELPYQRIQYGKPKHFDKIKLADVLEHPIWVGMVEDERYTEEYERPVVSQTDVDDVLLSVSHVSLNITLKVDGGEQYASGMLSAECDALDSLVVWNGKKWLSLSAMPSLAMPSLAVPLTLIAVPTIRDVEGVRFTCTKLASGLASRE